jgi:hypothetical protein
VVRVIVSMLSPVNTVKFSIEPAVTPTVPGEPEKVVVVAVTTPVDEL